MFGFQQSHGIDFYPDMQCHLIPMTCIWKFIQQRLGKFQMWQASGPLTHDGSVDLRTGGAKSQTWQLDPIWYRVSHRDLTGRWSSGWMGRDALGSFQVLWWNTDQRKLGEGKVRFILQVRVHPWEKTEGTGGRPACYHMWLCLHHEVTAKEIQQKPRRIAFSPHDDPSHGQKKST